MLVSSHASITPDSPFDCLDIACSVALAQPDMQWGEIRQSVTVTSSNEGEDDRELP